jgi:hypothetical protein
LGLPPLRWIGERSYGIYLWHLPVMAFMPQAVLAAQPALRAGVQLGLIILLSALSWAVLENPIRTYGFLGALGQGRYEVFIASVDSGRAAQPPRVRTRLPVLLPGSLALLLIATLSLTATTALGPTGTPEAEEPSAEISLEAPQASTDVESEADPSGESGSSAPQSGQAASLVNLGTDAAASQTSCNQVMYVADPNAQQAVAAELDRGYQGCWLVTIGTRTEAADQPIGRPVSWNERIDLIMNEIGNQPVLWLTAKTQQAQAPYANDEIRNRNAALIEGCTRYPNMHVYDWAGQVENKWFLSDGIHLTTGGYRERDKRIAQALAIAFPKQGNSPGECLIKP